MIIYRWENRINGKNYVGKWEGKLGALISRYGKEVRKLSIKNRAIINAIRFHGFENFELKIVHKDDNLNRRQLEDLEIFYIREFRSLTIENGYNCTRGGDGGDTFTYKTEKMREESRKRMSGRVPWNKGKKGLMPDPWNKGRTGVYSEETRKRISKTLTGKRLSEESKKKISERHKNIKLHNRIIFTENELEFIYKNINKGRRVIARLFNEEFKTNYSNAPFDRIKKQQYEI
jgi:group I intron endonuclease